MTKIDIISGFLGAGKTTLIKKMIEEVFQGQKIVLIENEFGEVGIDGGFLKDAGIEITELNSGCICCSLVGDFDRNLKEVLDRFHPDRILIEPSGVGKLSDVMKSVIDLEKERDVKLNALVTVVNAMKASKQMKAFGEFFNNQIEFATTIVLSRTQNVSQEKLELCVRQMQALNEKAAIITTPWEAIDGEAILKVMEQSDSMEMELLAEARHAKEAAEHAHHHAHDQEGHSHGTHDHKEHCGEEHHHGEHCGEEHHHGEHCGEEHHHGEHGHGAHCHHGHHHADEIFTSWGKETPHKYDPSVIEQALKVLSETDDYGTVLRAKGMVEAADGTWIYFDMVPGEYELRQGQPEYTGRLCVIGCGLAEERLLELFELA
jgi:G3E family GTPase